MRDAQGSRGLGDVYKGQVQPARPLNRFELFGQAGSDPHRLALARTAGTSLLRRPGPAYVSWP